MAAAVYPITIEQGATYTLSMVYRGPNVDAVTPGDPIDLTGCTARMQIRKTVGGTPLVTVTNTDDIHVGNTDGRIDIIIPEAQTILLTAPRAKYDLYISFPDGTVRRLLEGGVTVVRTITDPPTP